MDSKYRTPDVLIKVRFLLSKEGGRETNVDGTTFDYGCPINIDGQYFDCRFIGNEKKSFNLGEWHDIYIKFLSSELAMPHFTVGKHISLWEGKVIAEGIVVKNLNDVNSQCEN